MMKETLKEQTPIFDDVEQQQRSSEIKETSPHNKSKNKSVKFLEKKQEDEDVIFIRIYNFEIKEKKA